MTRHIVSSSLRFRLLVLVVAAGLVVVGVGRLRSAPVDIYPEFTPPQVEIQTEALGLSASEVEQLITVPLEADLLNGVAWLDKIRSESIPGLSAISLLFEPGTNLLKARQMVQERLNQPNAIPSVSKPPVMLAPVSSTSRTMMIGLSSDKLSLIDMSVLARWTIRPRLMGVSGVANVSIFGQRDRQLQVQVDPQRLAERGVSLNQVVSTAGNSLWVSSLSFLEASTPGTGGFFDAPNQRLAVRHVSPIINPADLGQVTIEPDGEEPAPTGPDGQPLQLDDVADVVQDHQPLIGDAIVNGKPGLMLVVEKLPTAHTLDVTRGIQEALEALRPGLAGVKIDDSVFRPATFIHKATSNVGTTLLLGLGLLILALALLLYEWRAALVVVVAVTLSLLTAVLVVHLRGSTINAMVVAGLAVALGVIVDDAVRAAELVGRRLRERGPDVSVAAAVAEATTEARRGLAFTGLIVALPLLPVAFLPGLGGAFGRPLAVSYLLALGASIVVAVTLIPALAYALFSRGSLPVRESPVMRLLAGRYERLLGRATRTARPAYVAVAVMALVGLVVVPQLSNSPLPTFKETDFLVELDGPPGTSLPEMNRITTRVSRELSALPGIRSVGGHVGRAVTSDKVVSTDASVLWVSVDPEANYDGTVAAVKRVIRGYPGIDVDFMTYSEERLKEVRSGAGDPVVVRLFGQDLDVLRRKAGDISKALNGVKGLVDVRADLPVVEPTLQVEVDLQAAKAAGIKPGDVRRAAATLLSGVQVGSLFEEQKVFDVVVWGTPAIRQNVTTIRDLLIDTPSGRSVRLGDVAAVELHPAPNVVERDAVSRLVDVTAGIQGRSRGAVLADVGARLGKIRFPLEYHYELVGDYADRQDVHDRSVRVGLIAAVGILLLLQATFRNWRLAALAFVTLPLALTGAVLAVQLDGGELELGSLLGFLAVFGIAVRQSVRLIRRYQHLERRDGALSGADVVARGSREQLRPVLVGAAATAAVFLPFAALGDLAGHEIVNPMGGVVLGGLVSSTVLALFILPALYLRFAYGRAAAEDLDLSELWELEFEAAAPVPVTVGTTTGADARAE